MSNKILVLFQNEIEIDKEPDWILGFSLGEKFEIQTDPNEPLFTHYVLPLDQYQKILAVVALMSYETNPGRTPYYNLKYVHLDSVLDMINDLIEYDPESESEISTTYNLNRSKPQARSRKYDFILRNDSQSTVERWSEPI